MKYRHDAVEDITHVTELKCFDVADPNEGTRVAKATFTLSRDDYLKIAAIREWLTPRYPRIQYVAISVYGGRLTTADGKDEDFYPCQAQVYPNDLVFQGWSNGRLYFSESVHV